METEKVIDKQNNNDNIFETEANTEQFNGQYTLQGFNNNQDEIEFNDDQQIIFFLSKYILKYFSI